MTLNLSVFVNSHHISTGIPNILGNGNILGAMLTQGTDLTS